MPYYDDEEKKKKESNSFYLEGQKQSGGADVQNEEEPESESPGVSTQEKTRFSKLKKSLYSY